MHAYDDHRTAHLCCKKKAHFNPAHRHTTRFAILPAFSHTNTPPSNSGGNPTHALHSTALEFSIANEKTYPSTTTEIQTQSTNEKDITRTYRAS